MFADLLMRTLESEADWYYSVFLGTMIQRKSIGQSDSWWFNYLPLLPEVVVVVVLSEFDSKIISENRK